MSSWFELELDIASPQLTITMPTNTIPQNVVEIEIKSNEILSDYQNIYVVDAVGVKHNYIFNRLNDYTYYGLVNFQDYPLGIATLFVRLKDEVLNESELYSKTINIGYVKDNVECFIDIYMRTSEIKTINRDFNINIFNRDSNIDTFERDVDITVINHKSNISYEERITDVEVINHQSTLEVVD